MYAQIYNSALTINCNNKWFFVSFQSTAVPFIVTINLCIVNFTNQIIHCDIYLDKIVIALQHVTQHQTHQTLSKMFSVGI